MMENLQPNRIKHSRRPGSFGAFLLAIRKSPTENSVETEIKRALGAGMAKSAVDSVLRRLHIEGLAELSSYCLSKRKTSAAVQAIKLTAKGLQYLQEHGLIAV